MYEAYYGFKEKPFNITPDPDYLFMSTAHERTYTYLEYAVMESKAFVVITGEIGAGKTTLINYLLRKIEQDIQVGLINNTRVLPLQLIKMICQEFEIKVDGMDKISMVEAFHNFLLEQFSAKRRVILIIDEAQNLPAPSIEEIRLLSNLESEKSHLLQIILLGQPELKHKLQRKDLEQFKQRITVSTHLEGLKKEETAEYIRHRLRTAGAPNQEIFTPEAIEAIHKYSKGIPRVINILCDTALVHGYADDAKIIDATLVQEAAKTRDSSGVFTEAESPDLPEGAARPVVAPYFLKRFRLIEKKTLQMENTVKQLQQQVNDWAARVKNREARIQQLLKVFQQNQKSRRELAQRNLEMKKQLDLNQERFLQISKQIDRLSRRIEESGEFSFTASEYNDLQKKNEKAKKGSQGDDFYRNMEKITIFPRSPRGDHDS